MSLNRYRNDGGARARVADLGQLSNLASANISNIWLDLMRVTLWMGLSVAVNALNVSPMAGAVTRRAALLLPIPLLLPAPAWSTDGLGVADGSIGDKFTVVVNGQTRQMTEIEARDALTKKVEAATAAGKGLDVERRGQFNEKALFSEDFYFKYGLRPTPDDMKAKPIDPDQMPFVPVQRRYTGYKKYQERVSQGIALYSGELRTLIQEGKWAELKPFLDIGTKGQGSNAQGEGTGVPASPMRSSCRALGLFANTVLQSDNDNGTTYANLLVRHFVNELYFALDDIAAAAAARDTKAAKLAWTRGRDYINTYLEIVNRNINAKVGDKFAIIDASL